MSFIPEAIFPARIQNARMIQGWMDEAELDWLARQAESSLDIVEIGSWKGRSTVALAENTAGIVYAVDTWEGSVEHWHGAPWLGAADKGPKGRLFREFRKSVRDLPVIPMVMTSAQAAGVFKEKGVGNFFDLIFIDASHDYESVKADILAWQPLLKEDGILCGHDYGTWPDVKRAVDELLPTASLVVGSIWAVQ